MDNNLYIFLYAPKSYNDNLKDDVDDEPKKSELTYP